MNHTLTIALSTDASTREIGLFFHRLNTVARWLGVTRVAISVMPPLMTDEETAQRLHDAFRRED